ncbi:hypothetical protein DACRYDRAFT_17143 [Dacryopinax primogenitus]|uniref:Uncharacterized protein n=1 Tax=Dacryopinax primogenitus (strain DJM 731) TaxID=1858805 RepID=M5FS24_DACPD|nr:uncharacterized protein DACRYDRAFT_17143 [Dacryopinax primogenitus]EJU00101.1 hypothetical protein DACRYDRAFT_17143 [Dacryopinax primogenitus]
MLRLPSEYAPKLLRGLPEPVRVEDTAPAMHPPNFMGTLHISIFKLEKCYLMHYTSVEPSLLKQDVESNPKSHFSVEYCDRRLFKGSTKHFDSMSDKEHCACHSTPPTPIESTMWMPYIHPSNCVVGIPLGDEYYSKPGVWEKSPASQELEQLFDNATLTVINAWWAQTLIRAHQHFLLLSVFKLSNLPPSHPLLQLYNFNTLEKTWAGDFAQEQIDLFMPMPQAYAHVLWVHAQAKPLLPSNLPTLYNYTSVCTGNIPHVYIEQYQLDGISILKPLLWEDILKKDPKANLPWKDLNKSKMHTKGKKKATDTLEQLQGNELFAKAAILHQPFYGKVRTRIKLLNVANPKFEAGALGVERRGHLLKGEEPPDIDYEGQQLQTTLDAIPFTRWTEEDWEKVEEMWRQWMEEFNCPAPPVFNHPLSPLWGITQSCEHTPPPPPPPHQPTPPPPPPHKCTPPPPHECTPPPPCPPHNNVYSWSNPEHCKLIMAKHWGGAVVEKVPEPVKEMTKMDIGIAASEELLTKLNRALGE